MIEPPLNVRSRGLPRSSTITMESIWLFPAMAIGDAGPRGDEKCVYADYNLSSLTRNVAENAGFRSENRVARAPGVQWIFTSCPPEPAAAAGEVERGGEEQLWGGRPISGIDNGAQEAPLFR
jgi:hypothetical protein